MPRKKKVEEIEITCKYCLYNKHCDLTKDIICDRFNLINFIYCEEFYHFKDINVCISNFKNKKLSCDKCKHGKVLNKRKEEENGS